MAASLELRARTILALKLYSSEEVRVAVENWLEDFIDFTISSEPQVLASAEQLKALFLQISHVAMYRSEPVGVIQSVFEEEAEKHAGSSRGAVLFRRAFPIRRKVKNLCRIPPEVIGKRSSEPKLTIAIEPSIFDIRKLIINMRDLTALHFAAQSLNEVHPFFRAAEIKLSWPDQRQPVVAEVGYETDHRGEKMQPHWDSHPLKMWEPMTVPQAKMLSRILPQA